MSGTEGTVEPSYTVLDTTLTNEERCEWHARLRDPETWRQLRDAAERMLRQTEEEAS